jgi:hypothetical protein
VSGSVRGADESNTTLIPHTRQILEDSAAILTPMALALPESLWPSIHRLATGDTWPPQDEHHASVFVQRVTEEGLLPLLAATDALPAPVVSAREGRKAFLSAQRVRAALIGQALSTMAGLLGDEPFIVLKGCDLAYRLYARPDLRPMGDIDVLVREGRMGAVASQLQSAGLREDWRFARAGARVDSHHEVTFVVNDVSFELHHRLIQKQRHRIDYEGLWRRAEPFRLSTFEALRLADADNFAYATLSVALKYFIGPLVRIVDLWLLRQATPGILEEAAARSVEWRTRHAFYCTLRFAGRILPEFRSPDVESAARSVVSSWEAAFLDRHVVPAVRPGPKAIPGRTVQLWRKYWMMDNVVRRSAFLVEHAVAVARGQMLSLSAKQ